MSPRAGLEFGAERKFASAGSRITKSGLSSSQRFNLWFNDTDVNSHLHVLSVKILGPKLADCK
jgi:hypothetical protein